MKLNILGSSSSGNCYILQSDSEALIIEVGLRMTAIKEALGFNLNKVAGCIVSHLHNDHARSVEGMLKAGIDVYALSSVFEAKRVGAHRRAKTIILEKGFTVGQFRVYAFPVAHDVPTLGFLINHNETGNILFLTDTFTCDYQFTDLSHILIEANYSTDILDKNISSGRTNNGMKRRLRYSHMELQTTKKLLSAHDLSNVKTITLIHLSSDNSDEKRFVEEIRALTGIVTRAASSGLEIELLSKPF